MPIWIAVQCPDCHSTDIIKHGKSLEDKQRYLCQNSECLRRTFITIALFKYLPEGCVVKQCIDRLPALILEKVIFFFCL